MSFKVGQKVVLINDDGKVAFLGAEAVIYRVSISYIYVKWLSKDTSNCQCDGAYRPHDFRRMSIPGEQLLFDFMKDAEFNWIEF